MKSLGFFIYQWAFITVFVFSMYSYSSDHVQHYLLYVLYCCCKVLFLVHYCPCANLYFSGSLTSKLIQRKRQQLASANANGVTNDAPPPPSQPTHRQWAHQQLPKQQRHNLQLKHHRPTRDQQNGLGKGSGKLSCWGMARRKRVSCQRLSPTRHHFPHRRRSHPRSYHWPHPADLPCHDAHINNNSTFPTTPVVVILSAARAGARDRAGAHAWPSPCTRSACCPSWHCCPLHWLRPRTRNRWPHLRYPHNRRCQSPSPRIHLKGFFAFFLKNCHNIRYRQCPNCYQGTNYYQW